MADADTQGEGSRDGYKGLTFKRLYTQEGDDVYTSTPMRTTDVVIEDAEGKVTYRQDGVKVPESWSDQAAKVVSSKYLKDKIDGEDEKEYDTNQLVSRVADTIADQGVEQGYFDAEQGRVFRDELAHILLDQRASFNSPVWFNTGLGQKYGFEATSDETFHAAWDPETGGYTHEADIYQRPQVSACFISSVDDNMGSILDVSKREAMLFKWGSGNGANFSTLRGYHEPLSHGGKASGLMYFLKGFDVWAGVIKSGGKTRRAAKMVTVNDDHPDIFRFVTWKGEEEKKAKGLQIFGKYAPVNMSDLDDEAHFSITGQNSNNSVRFSDAFMEAYEKDGEWDLKFVTARGRGDVEETEIPMGMYDDDRHFPDEQYIHRLTNKRKVTRAKTLMDLVAETARASGDPGVQFDGTINRWHTCPNSGRIDGSNPCSEYMFLDDSACNLASVNFIKYIDDEGNFDVEQFQHDVRLMFVAQDIMVDFATYPGPDESIAKNSHEYRPLGMGYGNLGALLMRNGIAYDSDEGRNQASALTSLLTATAYNTSAEMAEVRGNFEGFETNREPFMKVMGMHRDATHEVPNNGGLEGVLEAAKSEWDEVVGRDGFRNAQATLIAPTGTIGFMLDFDSFGVEPGLALASQKSLSGGGKLDIVSQSVEPALRKLGYSDGEIAGIKSYILEEAVGENGKKYQVHPWINEGTPGIKPEHIPIFATALGANAVSAEAHLGMMGATQPFLSGAISKTVNLPKGTTTEEIESIYVRSHQMGLKSVALYIDGSKGDVQPMMIGGQIEGEGMKWGERKRLPNEHDDYKFRAKVGPNIGAIDGTPVHFHFGEDPDTGMPLEFFASFGGSGNDYGNVYDSFFKSMSRAVQYGEPLEKLVGDHIGANGAINGWTSHPNIKSCASVEDLWAKVVAGHYLGDTSSWQVQPNPNQLRINVLKRRKKFELVERLIHPEYYENGVGEELEGNDEEEESGQNGNQANNNGDHKPCIDCGGTMERSGANCYKCPNCLADTGCG